MHQIRAFMARVATEIEGTAHEEKKQKETSQSHPTQPEKMGERLTVVRKRMPKGTCEKRLAGSQTRSQAERGIYCLL